MPSYYGFIPNEGLLLLAGLYQGWHLRMAIRERRPGRVTIATSGLRVLNPDSLCSDLKLVATIELRDLELRDVDPRKTANIDREFSIR
jgi:hypothetical protein